MRAVAEDQATASLMGINVNRIISLTFLIAGHGGRGGRPLRCAVQPDQPVHRVHPRAQGFYGSGARGIGNITGP